MQSIYVGNNLVLLKAAYSLWVALAVHATAIPLIFGILTTYKAWAPYYYGLPLPTFDICSTGIFLFGIGTWAVVFKSVPVEIVEAFSRPDAFTSDIDLSVSTMDFNAFTYIANKYFLTAEDIIRNHPELKEAVEQIVSTNKNLVLKALPVC